MKSTKKIKLILSCDTKNEIDDQFAIYYALKSPEIDLLGVVSVQNQRRNGKNSVDLYHNEAKKILRLAKSKAPCFKGSRHALDLDNLEKSAGVKFIIGKILNSKETITVASTGPCTDLANAIFLEPKIMAKANFIWLGGAQNTNNKYQAECREVNFLGDRLAAKALLNSNANLTLVPVEGMADCLVLNSQILAKRLKIKKTPIANYLALLLETNWKRIGPINYFLPKALKQYWVFCDIAAIAVTKNFGMSFSNTPKNGSIKIINEIDTYKILAQFEKYILN